MLQHILLMTVAAPLVLLGAPGRPFLQGLPQRFVRRASRSLPPSPLFRRLGRVLTDPAVCWVAAMGVLVGWHVPFLFDLALRSGWWHLNEHLSFFATGLLFWLPVVQPWPGTARWPRWSIPLYLFLATMPCDALAAFLTFRDRVFYTGYLAAPHLFHLSALQDQEFAGALMWVSATILYLIPAVIVTIQMLSPSGTLTGGHPPTASIRAPGQQLSAKPRVSL